MDDNGKWAAEECGNLIEMNTTDTFALDTIISTIWLNEDLSKITPNNISGSSAQYYQINSIIIYQIWCI